MNFFKLTQTTFWVSVMMSKYWSDFNLIGKNRLVKNGLMYNSYEDQETFDGISQANDKCKKDVASATWKQKIVSTQKSTAVIILNMYCARTSTCTAHTNKTILLYEANTNFTCIRVYVRLCFHESFYSLVCLELCSWAKLFFESFGSFKFESSIVILNKLIKC